MADIKRHWHVENDVKRTNCENLNVAQEQKEEGRRSQEKHEFLEGYVSVLDGLFCGVDYQSLAVSDLKD